MSRKMRYALVAAGGAVCALILMSIFRSPGGEESTSPDPESVSPAETSAAESVEPAESVLPAESTESFEESLEPGPAPALVGGWTINTGDTAVEADERAAKAFELAAAADQEHTYDPIALLATQVVAGTNYCFAARVTAAGPDALPEIRILYVYADLSGNAEIIGEDVIVGEVMPGSFEANAGDLTLEANEEVKAAWDKALEGLLGVDYEPVAYLAKQIVSGSNYLILCRTTVVHPDAVPEFSLVTIYQDLQGNAKFGESEPIEIGLP